MRTRKPTDQAIACNVETKLHRGEVVAPSLQGNDRRDRLLASSMEKECIGLTAGQNRKLCDQKTSLTERHDLELCI